MTDQEFKTQIAAKLEAALQKIEEIKAILEEDVVIRRVTPVGNISRPSSLFTSNITYWR